MKTWLKRQKSGPARPLLRRALRLARTVLVLCLLCYLSLLALAPLLVSTGKARQTLEKVVSDWTGQTARISGMPTLSLFPHPRITLPDVTITRRTPDGPMVIAEIASLSASFGLIDGMIGRPQFQEFELVGADIRLARAADGTTDWQNSGLLMAAIKATDSAEELAKTKNARIGTVRMVDGRVRIEDAVTGRNLVFSNIDATLSWPRLKSRLSLTIDASLHERRFGADISSTMPLQLLSGHDADIDLTTRFGGMNGHFAGTVNLAGNYQAQGPISLDVADAQAFEHWSGLELRGFADLQHASLSAQVSTVGNSYRLANIKAVFDDADIQGILEISPQSGSKANMNGTLAFDQIDLRELFDSVLLLPEGDASGQHQPAVPDWLDIDVTMSAKRATFGPLAMTDVATSLTASGEHRRLDIIDSTFAGGSLTATLDDATKTGTPGRLALVVNNADLASLSEALTLPGPIPSIGTGSLRLALQLQQPIATTSLRDLSGSLSLQVGTGVLRPFNLAQIESLAAQRPFFHLSETTGGELAFSSLSAAATLKDGTAELTDADIVTAAGTISIDGLLPLQSGGLALSAQLQAPSADGDTSPQLSLFIGGAWPDPILSSRFPLGAKSLQ